MSKRLLSVFAASLVISLLILAVQAGAGVSGKISGVVEDTVTGEPVVGATVRVLGLDMVTTTDEDGDYFMIGVPVGEYDVVVSHVGFETVVKEGVRVLLDLTSPVNFEVRQVAIDLKREVVVRAANPIIKLDLTASRSIFTADRLSILPNTVTVQSVLTNYPGVVVDKNQNMHVRGGRSGQVAYYLDGFSVQDPFVANSGLRIIPDALEELSLLSGGFTAEYGEALSGVVNAVTREGGAEYQGSVRYYEALSHNYDVTIGKWNDLSGGSNRSGSFDLSGPVPGFDPKKYTFFVAGEYLRDDNFLPHNQTSSYTGITKLIMKPSMKFKVKANLTYYRASGEVYDHRDVNGVSYDFNLDGLPSFEREAYLVGFTSNYTFSERTILTASLNRFSTNTLSAPTHLMDLHWSQWPGYSEDEDGVYNGTIDDDNYNNNPDFSDPYEMTGFAMGDDFEPTYAWREAQYNSASAALVAQLSKSNQIKVGMELRKYDIERDFKQFYNTNPYSELYSSKPMHTSFYVQSKLEYADLVVNSGLRLDHRSQDVSYNVTPLEATPTYKEAESKTRLAPRLGVSFPISEKSVMHFNYGTYYQVPLYRAMYFNLEGDVSSGLPILGNPDLSPERTTSFELGLDHLIGDGLRIDLTAYYKDIEDLVTTRSSVEVGTSPITFYDNGDYGSAKGFDLALEKLRGDDYYSASVSYTYMIATGNGSTAEEPYYTYITDPDEDAPITEYPLDFDQRHTLTAVVEYGVPRDWSSRLFGIKIPGSWGVTFAGYYGSGLPYTKTDQSGHRLGERNEGRLPSIYSVDARFNKNFHFSNREFFLTFFLEVDNVFNRHNVLNVYSRTGLPDDDADMVGSGLALDQDELDRLDYLYDHDPQNYSPPRTIRTGLEFNF